jgi:8-oxo-dGTP pyrophosphatase MutT (NUDIX family)
VPSDVRPADAAGLVLLREGPGGTEVLMGRRHGRAKFLPDIYVFPGGRVEPADRQPTGFPERIEPGLSTALRRGAARYDPIRLLRAAVRETYEETGLMLAVRDAAPPTEIAGVWRDFAEQGLRPRFEALRYVCRAITPRGSHRRYNTRFFLADGSQAAGEITGDGELEDLAWRPVEAMAGFSLVDVTEFVLQESVRRWKAGIISNAQPAPLLRYVKDAVRVTRR